jgi:UDP-glucose 4-epimerase
VIDNLVTGFRWAIADEAPFYEGDISDSDLVLKIIGEQAIDAIMHFAGSVVVPESVENPLKHYNNNTAKSRSLIETAITGGVRHMIFSSTAAT